MNPLKIEIVERENDPTGSEILSVLGAIAWAITATVCWFKGNLFDDTAGRLLFIPILIISGTIGYYTTAFLVKALFIITVIAVIAGWIFDFSFFDILLK